MFKFDEKENGKLALITNQVKKIQQEWKIGGMFLHWLIFSDKRQFH